MWSERKTLLEQAVLVWNLSHIRPGSLQPLCSGPQSPPIGLEGAGEGCPGDGTSNSDGVSLSFLQVTAHANLSSQLRLYY